MSRMDFEQQTFLDAAILGKHDGKHDGKMLMERLAAAGDVHHST